MSKKKKTLDELLEEALVSEDEQPYEIPANWVWGYLKDISEINMGASPKGEYTTEDSNFYPLVGGPADMGVRYPKVSRYTKKPTKLSSIDEVIISVRATLGKTNISDAEYCLGRGVAGIKSKAINVDFLRYYFETITSYLYEISTGTTFQQISRKDIEGIPFPLLPFEEQERIARKIEILFAKLDDAKQLIEEVKGSFEFRRAAILTKAFEMYEPTSYKTIEEVCTIKNGYAFKSKDFVDEGIQLVRMGNLYQNQLDLSRSPVYLPTEYNEKLLDKYSIKNGDILLSLTGTKYKRDYGYAVKVEHLDRKLLLNQRIMSLTSNTEDDYLFYFLQTPEFRNDFFSFETGGVNQGNVGSKSVATIKIPWIDDISKRKEVVNSIQKQFEVEKFVSEILNNQIDIDNLKQSILSKAFKGGLGTNDLADEPAIELLKSILQEKL